MMERRNKVMEVMINYVIAVLFPLKMLIMTYSMCILMIDIVWVIVNAMYAILQSLYQLIRPPPLKSLSFETAMVVGSGRGIGYELAQQLANLGAIVLCVDKDKVNNEIVVREITSHGGSAFAYTLDITKNENIAHLASQIRKDVGVVNMLFYCCGIPSPRSLLMQPSPDVHVTMDLTMTAFYWLIEQFITEMKDKDHGHIVALTSVAGLSHLQDQLPLSIAQFAVQGLAESLREDLRTTKKYGVHVTLMHIYPFIVSVEDCPDLRLRIPSYFGTISPEAAASSVLDSVRRNYVEASVPKHLLYLGHLLRVLPRKATVLIRELLDTGVDFA